MPYADAAAAHIVCHADAVVDTLQSVAAAAYFERQRHAMAMPAMSPCRFILLFRCAIIFAMPLTLLRVYAKMILLRYADFDYYAP